jgi:hypothetical protein
MADTAVSNYSNHFCCLYLMHYRLTKPIQNCLVMISLEANICEPRLSLWQLVVHYGIGSILWQ